MKIHCKPQITFSKKEYEIVDRFYDLCSTLRDTLDNFKKNCDDENPCPELNNIVGMDWDRFCLLVAFFQDFVADRYFED